MLKKIYLVRHAQGEHNIADNFYVRDSLLTAHGKKQCHDLQAVFPYQSEIQIVMASPLRRAIQTAIESFTPALLRPEVSLLLVPQAQEISAKPCDVGHEREELEAEMKRILKEEGREGGLVANRIDYSILEPRWTSKQGIYEDSLQAVEARAAQLRKWLWTRPETSIVLVTHGAFLHYLTEDWSGFSPSHGTAYKNCEFRCFAFTEESNESEAHLKEIGNSSRRGLKPPGTHSKDIKGVDSN